MSLSIKFQRGDRSFIKTETPAQVFPVIFAKFLRTTNFVEPLRTAASEKRSIKSNSKIKSLSKISNFLYRRAGSLEKLDICGKKNMRSC